MPVQPTYPGVYIEEIPSGVRTLTGVATSITAFVGRALKGPADDPVTINSYGDYERVFGGLWQKSPMSFAVRDFFLNGGGQAVIVRLHKDGEASTITLKDNSPTPKSLVLEASSVGAWGKRLSAVVDHITAEPANDKQFNLTVFEKDLKSKQILKTEKFLNVSVDPNEARYVSKVLKSESALVRVKIDGGADKMSSLRPVELTTDAAGGKDGSHIVDDTFTGTGKEAAKEGLYALEKTDLFNLLCIPPYSAADGTAPKDDDQATDVTTSLIASSVAYCTKRRAMMIVDSHSSWKNKTTAKTSFTAATNSYPGTQSNYAALFFPRLMLKNPLKENQVEEFAGCGAVAGVFARTDAQRGVWKAPAGQDARLVGVPELSVSLTDDENGELNQLGINCLRAFPVYGRIVWGSRTLEGADRLASEWKYISVRRTALYIEESLFRGTKWVVFEPNDESLWAQIRLNVGAFMHDLFRKGAFQGTKPAEAYLVKCDSETTTQNDINQGVVNILVGFAPLKPAEFVFIKIQQLSGQVNS